MLLVIDNYDSFTYNLVQCLAILESEVVVRMKDEITVAEALDLSPTRLLVSPGPGRPEGAGISMAMIEAMLPRIPVLGVCLGHQALGALLGGKVVQARSLMHGKASPVHHDGRTLFEGFVARELIPVMQATGREQEEAALTLGAGAWRTFWHVTLPSVKWGLLYGIILCNARAMGEFGAVSVVSGHISGVTNTMPLHVEKLYNEYQGPAAFAVASVLALLALLTLGLKTLLEWKQRREYALARRRRPSPRQPELLSALNRFACPLN